jgi:hypothetical protein
MNDKIDGSMGRRSPRGLRQFFHQISQMANSPWGSGPGKGDDDGKGDGKKPGPRNPWVTPDPADQRRGPKPRGPSALDELLRKGRGGFGGGGSGGSGQFNFGDSAKFWKWGVVGVGVAWVLFSSFHIVPPEKEGVVTRLGSYSRTVGPGVKLTWPAPVERIRLEDVRAIRTMAVGSPNATDENFVLTRDQSIVDLAYEVRWSVRDPELFFFQLADPRRHDPRSRRKRDARDGRELRPRPGDRPRPRRDRGAGPAAHAGTAQPVSRRRDDPGHRDPPGRSAEPRSTRRSRKSPRRGRNANRRSTSRAPISSRCSNAPAATPRRSTRFTNSTSWRPA